MFLRNFAGKKRENVGISQTLIGYLSQLDCAICITIRAEHYKDHLDDNKDGCFSLYQNWALKCVAR